jgi:hypothetical protein
VKSLRDQADFICEPSDVILSGDSGYRLSETIPVQFTESPVMTDITDISDTDEVANVRDDDVRDVRDQSIGEVAERRSWILRQLKSGVELTAPMVAQHFGRSSKTAQRDLDRLAGR